MNIELEHSVKKDPKVLNKETLCKGPKKSVYETA